MSAAPFGGNAHNQKDHVFESLRRRYACRTHLTESAVTPSLVAETRKLSYQVYSLFTISNIARGSDEPFAKLCDYGRMRRLATAIWWSQTGSNRRPHACKARALPTELWPQSGMRQP